MQEPPKLEQILKSGHKRDDSGIWIHDGFAANPDQAGEIGPRENVAGRSYNNYLDEVASHHSIDVMDAEVASTVALLPEGAWILDVGGCWGWHWRDLSALRPDVSVVIVDFVKANLRHAQNVLARDFHRTVHLVQGDATDLPVRDGTIDLCWSVQCLQHIPQLDTVVGEAHRVLRAGGMFRTYDLNFRRLERVLYRLAGREYAVEQTVQDMFLRRSTRAVDDAVARIFGAVADTSYSEILFQPNLRLAYRPGSIAGRLDRALSGTRWIAAFARQRSISARK